MSHVVVHDCPTPFGAMVLCLSSVAMGAALAWGLFGPWRMADSAPLAAWSGALGSLLMVGVAAFAPMWHAHQMRLLQKRQKAEQIAALCSMSADALDDLIQRVEEQIGIGSWMRYRELAIYRSLISALDDVSTDSFSDDQLIPSFISLRDCMHLAQEIESDVRNGQSGHLQAEVADLRMLAKRVDKDLERIIEVYEKSIGSFAQPTRREMQLFMRGLAEAMESADNQSEDA